MKIKFNTKSGFIGMFFILVAFLFSGALILLIGGLEPLLAHYIYIKLVVFSSLFSFILGGIIPNLIQQSEDIL